MTENETESMPYRNDASSGRIMRAAFILLSTVAFAIQMPARQGSPEGGDAEAVAGMYTGVVSCANTGCHGSPAPVANSNVLMNEYDSWLHAPGASHVKAYEVLHNAKSKLIAKNMRFGKPAWEIGLCLDCHSTNVPKALQSGAVELSDGVQCESCHGPAGGWRAKHTQDGWTHEDSVEAGMVDLRDPGSRNRNCLSCHMGDKSKTVDHDLIAAGHPILTFELDNFTESALMPPHWKKVSEKKDPASYGATSHGVRAWAVGQVVTFEEGMHHLVRRARSEQWPDFSAMSCAACHHNLRTGEWRQERGYDGRPGFPPWSPARWSVLRHLVRTFAPEQSDALESEIGKLSGLVATMGHPKQVVETATSVAERLSTVERTIRGVSWNEKNVRSLMKSIASDRDYFRANDRQSAEQATYALVSLSTHLVRVNPKLVRSDMVTLVDELYKTMDRSRFPDEFDNEKFNEILGRLDESLE